MLTCIFASSALITFLHSLRASSQSRAQNMSITLEKKTLVSSETSGADDIATKITQD